MSENQERIPLSAHFSAGAERLMIFSGPFLPRVLLVLGLMVGSELIGRSSDPYFYGDPETIVGMGMTAEEAMFYGVLFLTPVPVMYVLGVISTLIVPPQKETQWNGDVVYH